jgi:putative transposase
LETVKAIKTVSVSYQPSEEILQLLKDFRNMVNYCLDVGLKNCVTGRFKLTRLVYHKLTKHSYHSWYVLSVIEIATTILKNYRKAKKKRYGIKLPEAKKLMAKLGNQAFKIVDGELVFPLKPRQFIHIPLHKRALQVLRNVKLGSITITPTTIHISYSKAIEVREPKGWITIDMNEDNIMAVSSDGEIRRYDLSRLKKAGYGYFWRKRKIQQRYAKDRRVLRKSLNRLSENYRNLVGSELHKVSASIAKWCEGKGYGLIREDLKGLRKSVNKHVKRFNRFNGKIQEVSVKDKELKWFRKFIHMVDYKCLWFGVKVKSVNPKGSSSICPRCGSKLKLYPMGKVGCPKCNLKENRHIVACLNLLKASDVRVWFTLERPSNVAVKRPLTKPPFGTDEEKAWSKRGKGNYASPEELPEP